MIEIKSEIANVIYHIETELETLDKDDLNAIKIFNPILYFNDLESYIWCYDTKLPSGKWLENIIFNNELTDAKALIINK